MDWWNRNAAGNMGLFQAWVGDDTAQSKVYLRAYVRSKGYRSVLDCGCGLCSDYHGYKKENYPIEYNGIDMCTHFVRLAEGNGIPVKEGSIEAIPMEGCSFDVVYTRHVLEHLPEFEKGLSEIIRVCAREAIVIFFLKPGDELKIDLSTVNESPLYHNRYRKVDIEAHLKALNVVSYVWQDINENEIALHITKNLRKGYVCYCTQGWLPLAEITVRHIQEFSKYPIELVGINCDIPFDYSKLIKRQLSVVPEHKRVINYAKLRASYESSFDYGLIMDADMLPMKTVDNILDFNMDRVTSTYPVCARHPHNPAELYKECFLSLQRHLGTKNVVSHYVFANFLFTPRSKSFLKRCYETCLTLEQIGFHPVTDDESVLNAYLADVEGFHDVGYNYLPNYYIYDDFLKKDFNSEHFRNYTDHGCPVSVDILHGCKDLSTALSYSKRIMGT